MKLIHLDSDDHTIVKEMLASASITDLLDINTSQIIARSSLSQFG